MQQLVLPSPQQGNGQKVDIYGQLDGSVTLQQDHQKFDNSKVDGLDNALTALTPSDSSVPFTNGNNVMDSTIVPKVDVVEQSNAAIQPVPNFQAELEAFINNKPPGFMAQEDQMAEFDCFKEMNGSKDSLIWWSNDFETKSASSNSWDSTSVLPSQGMFQDYELGYNM